MILNIRRFGALIILISFAFPACQPNTDIVKPTRVPLPACGESVIEGYTDRPSYLPGEIIKAYLQSNSHFDCGLSFYSSNDNLVFTADVTLFPQKSSSIEVWRTGYDYSIYSEVEVPHDLPSGVYFIEHKIPVIIKSGSPADVTVVYPANTINAYNSSGGKSLYNFNSTQNIGAKIVSYLRPLSDWDEEDRCIECLKWFPTVPEVSFNYISDQDLNFYTNFSNTKVLVIIGHSEYWTRSARNNFDQFINSGNHALILSGNSMWWQVRYSDDRTQLICYRDADLDPSNDPLLKTIRWEDSTLNYPITKSIGADFRHGGYGLRADNGWNGFKITNSTSPLLDGLGLQRGDIIDCPSSECDGALIGSFDSDGYPVLDNPYNFSKYELVGFDKGMRGGLETYPSFVVMKATETSGIVVNTGSVGWCSSSGISNPKSGNQIKSITRNAILKLVNGENIFSN